MRTFLAAVVLAFGAAATLMPADAAARSHNPHPGYHGRNPSFWGYGNYIGRHHRFGPFATPGGYPRGMDPYVNRGYRR